MRKDLLPANDTRHLSDRDIILMLRKHDEFSDEDGPYVMVAPHEAEVLPAELLDTTQHGDTIISLRTLRSLQDFGFLSSHSTSQNNDKSLLPVNTGIQDTISGESYDKPQNEYEYPVLTRSLPLTEEHHDTSLSVRSIYRAVRNKLLPSAENMQGDPYQKAYTIYQREVKLRQRPIEVFAGK